MERERHTYLGYLDMVMLLPSEDWLEADADQGLTWGLETSLTEAQDVKSSFPF